MSTRDGSGVAGNDLGGRLSTAIVLFHQAVADTVGLSAADLKTLDLIRRDGPFSATDLAERTGLTGAAVTALIGRLSADGHISREVDPADRRRAIVRASEPAHPTLDAAYRSLGAALGHLISEYTPAEQAAIAAYLDRMVAALESETRSLRDGNT
ncbi:MarR family winged helix-turn-helix transcriptional regulator [Agromyces sp. GXQ0307]|uniref:MarR family winged helix-turn-helix transcriptional regulator n=1 Tax=Agromyces sp. GXQ0307 TaxID=3377835 RepID=UPI00383A55F7